MKLLPLSNIKRRFNNKKVYKKGCFMVYNRSETVYNNSMLKDYLHNQIIQYHPQTIRQLYYRCLGMGLGVEKDTGVSRSNYTKAFNQLKALRNSGEIPYSWIIDPGRYPLTTPTWNSSAEFLEEQLEQYRYSPWEDNHVVQVWTESKGLAEVIRQACSHYCVTLIPCGGQPSDSIMDNAIQRVPTHATKLDLLYIGDYDDAGLVIANTVSDKVYRHLEDQGKSPDVTFKRIGITPAQIQEYNLPTHYAAKAKVKTKIKWKVEAEAMPVQTMISIVRAELDRLEPDLEHAAEMTTAGRDRLKSLL